MNEVAVVDDDGDAAKEFAQFITWRTGLQTIAYSDPDEVVSAVKLGRIAIVVLDQQMPSISGNALFIKLRKIDRRIRGVMLTGQATQSEVETALNLGFDAYVSKAKALVELDAVVRTQFIKYQENAVLLDVEVRQPILITKRHCWPIGSRESTRLLKIEILDKEYIRDIDWVDFISLVAGQTEVTTYTMSSAWTVELETEASAIINAELAIESGTSKFFKLQNRLNSQISSKIREFAQETVSREDSRERTYTLSNSEVDRETGLKVISRKFQRAPISISARAQLIKECNCCNQSQTIPVAFLVKTGRVSVRQIDFLDDDSRRVYQLGFE